MNSDKAVQLLEERQRREQQLDLVDCLQLSDKMTVIAKDEHLCQKYKLG